jgi:hypothetical protein
MRIQSVLVSALFFSSLQAQAMGGRKSPTPNGDVFEQIVIPDALCGDGTPYSIYVRKGDPAKVLLHFEGGGACWSKGSCFGKVKFTSLHDSPGIYKNKYLGSHVGDTTFQDHTYVYLPYCTGDMHGGSHKAAYTPKNIVYHFGRSNFTKALAWLEENTNRIVERADDVILYGESAGALGVIMNLDQVAAIAGPQANKVALIDSPGLHFNDSIWNRFDSDYLNDIDRSLASNSMKREANSGILAPQMRNFCDANPSWKVGVTQSTQDMVMSALFGKLTPIQHYFRVLGKSGIHQSLWDPSDNCSSWVPDTTKHVFSIEKSGWKKETWDGVSNADYTRDLVQSPLMAQHPSHH